MQGPLKIVFSCAGGDAGDVAVALVLLGRHHPGLLVLGMSLLHS